MSDPVVDNTATNTETVSNESSPEKVTDNTAIPQEEVTPVVEEKKARDYDRGFETKLDTSHALVDMSTIELRAEDLYDKDKVDIEQLNLEDVWTLLQLVFFLLTLNIFFSFFFFSSLLLLSF